MVSVFLRRGTFVKAELWPAASGKTQRQQQQQQQRQQNAVICVMHEGKHASPGQVLWLEW